MEENKPFEFTGLIPDVVDARDHLYSDLLGAPSVEVVTEAEWDAGFDAFQAFGVMPLTQDQGQSYSCVAQAFKGYTRRLLSKYLSDSGELSAKFTYSQIFNPQGGAYLRDAAKLAATIGSLHEFLMLSYDHGMPPSEEFMRSGVVTPMLLSVAKKADTFTYRMIEGSTGDINIFAHAIKNFGGAVGAFQGTNEGWCRQAVRPPAVGELKWGHALDLCAFGKLDVAIEEFPIGTKCLFTKNSWGDRYAIKEGRWAGYQAIPEAYFKVSEMTAAGEAPGVYVSNSWVLVPDSALPEDVKIMDFAHKNEGKIIQDSEQSGGFALIMGGKALVASKDRLPELLATYITKKEGVPTPADIWNGLQKTDF